MENMWKQASAEVRQVYGRKYLESQFSGLDNASKTSPSSTRPVVDAFVDALTLENPKTRYLVDGGIGLVDKYCVSSRSLFPPPLSLSLSLSLSLNFNCI
mgnify:CR=1 FL=1